MKKGYFVLLLLILLSILFVFKERTENDSMPLVLTNEVVADRLSIYPDGTYSEGKDCGEEERINQYLEAIVSQNTELEEVTCKYFGFGADTRVFSLNFPSLAEGQKILMLKKDQALKEVIIISGEYPGNRIFDIKGDGTSVVFSFSGWNNPEKIIRLTPR